MIQWLVNILCSEPSAAELRDKAHDQFIREFYAEKIAQARAANARPTYKLQSSTPPPSHRGPK